MKRQSRTCNRSNRKERFAERGSYPSTLRTTSKRRDGRWEGRLEAKVDDIQAMLNNHLSHHWSVTLACLSVGVTSSVALVIDIIRHTAK
jgi:hypothetical protein